MEHYLKLFFTVILGCIAVLAVLFTLAIIVALVLTLFGVTTS